MQMWPRSGYAGYEYLVISIASYGRSTCSRFTKIMLGLME